MFKDDRLYAFVVAGTTRSRARIRRICIHKRWLKLGMGVACLVFCAALYGLYGVFRAVTHRRLEQENNRLRVETERQRQLLNNLKFRVEQIEDTSRRLATEIKADAPKSQPADTMPRGAGGPLLPMEAGAIDTVEARARQIEETLRAYEEALKERARIPSLWPVEGELSDDFGGRRDPFGGDTAELHEGQDIAAPSGAAVVATADGAVSFAGWQNGYGQIVVVEHGSGLTTRYAHLSKIEAAVGQQITHGDMLGRVGSTGRSTGPHLHYEVRLAEQPVNPRSYLPPRALRAQSGAQR
ncbi:MAG: M23 family metallopeptidase [Pyrinomonadaceae bacterium]